MTQTPPHRTLMLLHRLVDQALGPLLEPMQLTHATEGYVTVDRSDLDALVNAHGDPQAVLAGFGPRATASGVLIAEPALSSAILSRIWRSDRNAGAPLTQVEGEILRQFLARLVGAWATSWQADGVKLLPEFSMASSLSLLRPQLAEGRWHIARCVVREQGSSEALGVLLFAYPEALMPQLANEARSIMWRSRIDRGLSPRDQQVLEQRLRGPLKDVTITAAVRIKQHMTLGMLDSLERGDIVQFDEQGGEISFEVLDREVSGRLARSGDHLALQLTGPDTGGGHEQVYEGGGQGPVDPWSTDAPPEPIPDWGSEVA
ncbi:MAG: hypothetical protein H7287_01195 [Thermoleophilia bacterium]|nr:hypothetical protein [Thermoleophilia bacterium]